MDIIRNNNVHINFFSCKLNYFDWLILLDILGAREPLQTIYRLLVCSWFDSNFLGHSQLTKVDFFLSVCCYLKSIHFNGMVCYFQPASPEAKAACCWRQAKHRKSLVSFKVFASTISNNQKERKKPNKNWREIIHEILIIKNTLKASKPHSAEVEVVKIGDSDTDSNGIYETPNTEYNTIIFFFGQPYYSWFLGGR